MILWQWFVTPGCTISLGRGEAAFLACTNLAQQNCIRFGRNAGMRLDLFPDLFAGFHLGSRSSGVCRRILTFMEL